VSLFITALAFDSPQIEAAAKIGVLVASTIAGVVGGILLTLTTRSDRP
jgi:Na+/H+ antiporter NhaA